MLLSHVWEKINPRQPGISAIEKTIRAITLPFILLSGYQLYSDSRLLALAWQMPRLSLAESANVLLAYGLLPLATVLFWRRKAGGWVLFTGYIASALLGGLLAAWTVLTWKHTSLTAFDRLLPVPSVGQLLVQVAGASYLLYLLSRPALRAAFGVSAGQLRVALALAALLGVVALVV